MAGFKTESMDVVIVGHSIKLKPAFIILHEVSYFRKTE